MKKIGIIMLGIENSIDKLLGEFSAAMINAKYGREAQVVCFADYILENCGGSLKNIPIVNVDKLMSMVASAEIDEIIVAVKHNYLKKVCENIYRSLFRQVDTYVIREYICKKENIEELSFEEIFVKIDITKPILEYFEVHVCDHCNLKCKGCGHLSNVCEEYYLNFEQYVQDIQQIKKLYAGCQSIKILGGEPLLDKRLHQFVEVTRKVFPEADIYVGTNGILLPKAEPELFETMRRCSAWFMISGYKPTLEMWDRIMATCQKYDVEAICNGKIEQFCCKIRDKKMYNLYAAHRECRKNGEWCFTLREGKISPCITFYAEMMNKKFNAGLEITDQDYFDLYQETNGWDLDRKLYNPIPFCSYCGKAEMFEWKPVKREDARLEDYMIITDSKE